MKFKPKLLNQVLLPMTGIGIIVVGVLFWQARQNEQKISTIILATGSKTGNYYPFGKAIAEVVELHNPKIKIKVIESQGSDENMALIEAKKVDMAIVQNDSLTVINARSMAGLYRELFHLIVSKKSGIKNVNDLRGKRIALMSKGSGSYASFWLMAEHYGLRGDTFQYKTMSWEDAAQAFRNHQVDAIFRVAPAGNLAIRNLLENTDGELIDIDQGAAMKINLPYLASSLIPKGSYKAYPPIPAHDSPTVGVQASLLAAAEADPEVIKAVTTTLFENKRDLVMRNPLAAYIDMPGKEGGLIAPLHDGAQSYYDREKPDFFSEHSDALGLWLSIGTLVASGLWSLRSRLSEKQKNKADKYNLELIDLLEQVADAQELEEVKKIRVRLLNIFRQVVEDLDRDLISLSSFESFSFTWETAMATVRERERAFLDERLFLKTGPMSKSQNIL